MTGNDHQDLYAALLRAYPTYHALQRAVHFRLGQNLAEISLGANLREVMFALVAWATAQGRLPDLQALADHPPEGLPPAVPFLADPLPPGFVERPAEFDALKAQLRGAGGGAVAITTALAGAGGFGKTTLALALCHDPDVQAACPDGILWVTLGQQPDVLRELTTLYAALTATRPAFLDERDATIQLATALADRACLLVVDDVWDAAHLQPFLKGGPRCVRLFTTRNQAIAGTVAGDAPVLVDAMTGAEAVALLTARLAVPPASLAPFRVLAHRLGEWPLLLGLANRTLRHHCRVYKASLDRALAALTALLDAQGGWALDDPANPDQREHALARTLAASLAALEQSRHAADVARYRELGIFPEDTLIPLTTLAALWSTSAADAERTAGRLANLSLLRLDLSGAEGGVGLHDEIRRYLRANMAEAEQADLHARLVDGWGDPHALPDGYAWGHLAAHLLAAGRGGTLRGLLLDFAWLAARLDASDIAALMSDYEAYLQRMPNDGSLERVAGALRLAAHILTEDPSQLAGQLWGRLAPDDGPAVEDLLAGAAATPRGPWLRPLAPCLTPPGGPLRRTLAGHAGKVRAVAVTGDGRWAVSGGDDGTVRVWDLAGSTPPRTLRGHTGWVAAVAVMGDGRWAVSGGEDGTVRVWDLAGAAPPRLLTGHTGPVYAVAMTGDGRWAVSGGADGRVRVWDLAGAAPPRLLTAHTGPGRAVAMTGDGRWAVSGGADGRVRVWDLAGAAPPRLLIGHTDWVRAVAVTGDGRWVVSGGEDGTVRVWDLASAASPRLLTGPGLWVMAVAVTADGRTALSGWTDGTVRVWHLARAFPRILTGHTEPVEAVAMTEDGRWAVSGGGDGMVRVWDLAGVRPPHVLEGHAGEIRAVAVTADGRTALAGGRGGTVRVWDLAAGGPPRLLEGHSDWVLAVAVTADGHTALAGGQYGRVQVWGLAGGPPRLLEGHSDWVLAVAVTADGRWAVSGEQDGTVWVWDLTNAAPPRTLAGHVGEVRAVAVTADGRWAVSGGQDGTVRVWNLANAAPPRTLAGHVGEVRAVAVTADGRWAVSGGQDGTVRVWNLADAAPPRTLAGHTGSVNAVAVTADGRFALSAGEDRTLRLWDLATGAALARFEGDARFLCCALAADGRTAVAGDRAGAVHFLRVEGVGI